MRACSPLFFLKTAGRVPPIALIPDVFPCAWLPSLPPVLKVPFSLEPSGRNQWSGDLPAQVWARAHTAGPCLGFLILQLRFLILTQQGPRGLSEGLQGCCFGDEWDHLSPGVSSVPLFLYRNLPRASRSRPGSGAHKQRHHAWRFLLLLFCWRCKWAHTRGWRRLAPGGQRAPEGCEGGVGHRLALRAALLMGQTIKALKQSEAAEPDWRQRFRAKPGLRSRGLGPGVSFSNPREGQEFVVEMLTACA